MNTCLLIPILVGLISALLGYLLGKLSGGSNTGGNLNLQGDLDACKANSSKLNASISSLQAEIDSLKAKGNTNVQSFAAALLSAEASLAFDAGLAKSIYGKKVNQDDLKIVEGIGPKIEELYHAAGIKTWKALSETSVEKSQAILDGAGERYNIHNPGSWAKQALLAYQGKWQELKNWQESHKGGKE
jgi:predicted flap endonuclease-1-like 5' DNA nuclease